MSLVGDLERGIMICEANSPFYFVHKLYLARQWRSALRVL